MKPTLLVMCLLSTAAFADVRSEAFRGAMTDDRPRAEPPAAEAHVAVDPDLDPLVARANVGKTLFGFGMAVTAISVLPVFWELTFGLIFTPNVPLMALVVCGVGYLLGIGIAVPGLVMWIRATVAMNAELERRELADQRRRELPGRTPDTVAPMTTVLRF
jgi:hypothetical protein